MNMELTIGMEMLEIIDDEEQSVADQAEYLREIEQTTTRLSKMKNTPLEAK